MRFNMISQNYTASSFETHHRTDPKCARSSSDTFRPPFPGAIYTRLFRRSEEDFSQTFLPSRI